MYFISYCSTESTPSVLFFLSFLAAIRAEVLAPVKTESALRAKFARRSACSRRSPCRCGNRYRRRCRCVYRIDFVMPERLFAPRAINEAVGIPRAVVQIIIGIFNCCSAGIALLNIGQSAMPVCSLKAAHKPSPSVNNLI